MWKAIVEKTLAIFDLAYVNFSEFSLFFSSDCQYIKY